MATARVVKALQYEPEGKNAQRASLLEWAREEAPALPAAHWHLGYVRQGDCWVKYDQAATLAQQDERLAVYRRIRERHPDTVEGHWAMAEWCERHKMPDQRRAHLGKILQIHPEHPEARRLLGYRYVDGSWLTAGEIAQAGAQAIAAVLAMKKWQPVLTEIRTGLLSRPGKQQKVAAERWAALNDPAAVPAIEWVFGTFDEAMATKAIEKFVQMECNEASVALARQAVFSPWPTVREAATRSLKARALESYVPAMLSTMSSPIRAQMELFIEPGGRLVYRHAFFREGQNHNELKVLDVTYLHYLENDPAKPKRPPQAAPAGYQFSHTKTEVNSAERMADNAAALHAAKMDALAKSRAREQAVVWQNAAIQDYNRRICDVLTAATGQRLAASAESWWGWWIEHNEVYVPGYKPTTCGYHLDQQATGSSSRMYTEQVFTPIPRSHSCLAAGTPVWTEQGPVAIEKVRVGDRVLSQDVESGELAYKPVLGTTVREQAPITRLEFLGDAIRCSGGHAFWVAGQGWVKARETQRGMSFHGPDGTSALTATRTETPESVYNLIVADFHSYFVGKAMVLSHDITSRKPTHRRVPGLVER